LGGSRISGESTLFSMHLVKLLRWRAAELLLTSTVQSSRGGVLNVYATAAGSTEPKLGGPSTSSYVGVSTLEAGCAA
jgi:hypothetical protein